MSDNTKPASSQTITVGAQSEAAPQQSWVQRKVVAPIKNHPKVAIAVAAGVGLVAGSAFLGRKTATYDVVLELQPVEELPEESIVLVDTSSSDE